MHFRDRFGNTVLMQCAKRGLLRSAEYLIRHEADVDASNQDDETALDFALQIRNREMARLLMRWVEKVFEKKLRSFAADL